MCDSTCLLDFGCMTAIHKCPFCRKSFDYTPDDYHAKVLCPPGPRPYPFLPLPLSFLHSSPSPISRQTEGHTHIQNRQRAGAVQEGGQKEEAGREAAGHEARRHGRLVR
jgi:hypothetical protein